MGTKLKISTEKAILQYEGKDYSFPVVIGSEGEQAVDISNLRAESGLITLDNAYMNTGACESSITFIDGDVGILRYRGYPIEQLAEHSNFLEVAYLLMFGELPTATEMASFVKKVQSYASTETHIKNLIKSFPKESHPMGALSSSIVGLSASEVSKSFLNPDLTPDQHIDVAAQLMAQIKNHTAYFHRHAQGKDMVDADPKADYCDDFLRMLFGKKSDPEVVKALDILLILHADHEQNCSTSTVRLAGSSKANAYAAASAGINALWGPLHGGANQAVIEMLEEIHAAGGDYKKFLERAKDKNDSFKLMGFGHRVYKNFDPRAKIIKSSADAVLAKLGVKDPLLDIARGLETEALRDPYFVERKLYPNVDFYSGIIYRALGIPTNMFTAMFAIGRLPGWMAQWKEMVESSGMKIGRPRQVYTGATERKYSKK